MPKKSNLVEWLAKAHAKHNNFYDYSLVTEYLPKEEIVIICPDHGQFKTYFSRHLKYKCPACAGVKPLDTEEFKRKGKLKHNGKYSYEKTIYIDRHKYVIITCPVHGDFEQTSSGHLNGYNCRQCVGTDKTTLEKFLFQAKETHGDTYNYSKVSETYENRKSLITIICKIHGDFQQVVSDHIGGCGCQKCSGCEQLTQEDFLLRVKETHGDRYDYSLSEYKSIDQKVKIICKEHNVFEQSARTHWSGAGCSKCATEKNKIWDKEKFLEEANRVHDSFYLYDKADFPTSGKFLNQKITIICPAHGIFDQFMSVHLDGAGCKICGILKTAVTKKYEVEYLKFNLKGITVEETLKLNLFAYYKEFHKDKYNYSLALKEYNGSGKEITIICLTHGEFKQTPKHHRSYGCPQCLPGRLEKLTREELIVKLKEVHEDKYDYSLVEFSKEAKYGDKIKIICREHGQFEQTVYSHLSGSNCWYCVNGFVDLNVIIKKAQENGPKNAKYDYSESKFITVNHKIKIICKNHDEPYAFWQGARFHAKGHGCPKCVSSVSKAETEWLDFLKIPIENRTISHKIEGRNFKFDGFDPSNNTVYEFYGDYWHGNPAFHKPEGFNERAKKTFGELYERTLEKEKVIKKAGFKLITIWENDWFELKKNI